MSKEVRHTPRKPKEQGSKTPRLAKTAKQVRHTRLPGPKFRVFDPQARKYVECVGNRWPVQDEIKWVENSLNERELLGSSSLTDDEKLHLGIAEALRKRENPPDIEALRIWLGKVRDGKSWNDLVAEFGTDYRKHPEAAKSHVIRRYKVVEKYLVGGE